MTPRHPLAHLLPPWGRDADDALQRQSIADLLGVRVDDLDAIRMGSRYHYRPMTRPKPDGRERRILAPSPPLKLLQRRFLDAYLVHQAVHPSATAFRPGGSTVAHARPHAHGRLIATVDLRDFFESTRGGRVARWLTAQAWGLEATRVLMRLCVFCDGLPQGAPTSPCLSNLVNRRLDERLDNLARATGGVYTRYGDDLAFSWTDERLPGGFTTTVEEALARSGYEVQPRKGWTVGPARGGFEITGLTVSGDGRVSVPRALRWRAALLRWRAAIVGCPAMARRSSGLDGYLKMVDRAGSPGFEKRRGVGR